jgi:sulfoxide reductase catalytic subunit YedY
MILLRDKSTIKPSEITDEALFQQRRSFLRTAVASLIGSALPDTLLAGQDCKVTLPKPQDPLTPFDTLAFYNNYYEFSTNKRVVFQLAKTLTLRPWTLTIEGEVENPFSIDIDKLLTRYSSEQRIYRLRCVEGWAMVVPWDGIPLCQLLKRAAPTSRAKFVEFVSLHRPSEMIGQRRDVLSWPYREGLRIDEAMHPLTLLVTGVYGKSLPPQNGAPLRLAVPWKYGFKSAKAITHIRLVEQQPTSSWSMAVPSEYGFYANVNPNVPHPRWSQQRENLVGQLDKQATKMFNGYAEQVAHLYSDMDLKKYF